MAQIEVPVSRIPADVLRGIIEEFVSREGTDYGESEFSLDEKIESVRSLLLRGKAKVLYDEETESCAIVTGSCN